jgi:WD40 repeat protein
LQDLHNDTWSHLTEALDCLKRCNDDFASFLDLSAHLYIEQPYVLTSLHDCTGIESFKTLDLESLPPGRPHLQFKGHTHNVPSVTVSPDSTLLVSGSHDKTICIWNTQTGSELACLSGHSECQSIFRGHTFWVRTVAFSPFVDCISSGSFDRTVCIWKASTCTCTGVQLMRLNVSHWVWSVSFSPDGTCLAVAADDSPISIWNAQDGTKLELMDFGVNEEQTFWTPWAVAFSPDGTLLASGSADGAVYIRDSATGELLTKLDGHSHYV